MHTHSLSHTHISTSTPFTEGERGSSLHEQCSVFGFTSWVVVLYRHSASFFRLRLSRLLFCFCFCCVQSNLSPLLRRIFSVFSSSRCIAPALRLPRAVRVYVVRETKEWPHSTGFQWTRVLRPCCSKHHYWGFLVTGGGSGLLLYSCSHAGNGQQRDFGLPLGNFVGWEAWRWIGLLD